MADYHYSLPHRKPLGAPRAPPPSDLPLRQPPAPTHAHSRTVSSNIFPTPQPYTQPSYPQHPQPYTHNRRTPSTATASTTSSAPRNSTVSISLHRTPSSRSGQSITPTSYVALMRKQKATVWCDRSQAEDPRLALAQKAAKARAAQEVVGKTAKSGVGANTKGKIRHHGAQKTVGYSPATLLVGASGVPARLSASEVGDEEGERGERGSLRREGGKMGSGRSSLSGSGRVVHAGLARGRGRMSLSGTPPDSNSNGNTQNSSPAEKTASGLSGLSGLGGTQEEETPVPGRGFGGDYFQQPKGSGKSGGSGSSGEREDSFGEVRSMEAPAAKETVGKGAEDLSRRGSVDERAMTMRGPRLFVANPDLSD